MIVMILLIIVTIVFGYFLLLLLVRSMRLKEKENDLANIYERFVTRERMLIDHYEIIGQTVVAIDSKNRKLLFIDDKAASRIVDIDNISSTAVKEEKNNFGFIVRISLGLTTGAGNSHTIDFFNSSYSALKDLNTSIRKAGWWKKRIDRLRVTESGFSKLEYVV